jgi:hypothetical protein
MRVPNVAELIRLQAAVLVVNIGSAHAAKAATTKVPIVFARQLLGDTLIIGDQKTYKRTLHRER